MATQSKNVRAPLTNEETEQTYKRIKAEMHKALQAGETGDVSRSSVLGDCILLAASSPTFASELFNRSAGVFADKKTHTTESEGSWLFFTDMFGLPARLNSESEPERMDRERHNNKVSAAQQFVRYAASIFYAIGTVQCWSEFERGKNKGVLMLGNDGAKLLFPKRAASLDKSEYTRQAITHRAGEYRFSSIADAGKSLLEAKGIKAKSAAARQKPIRDVMTETQKAMESADKKSLDASTRRNALAALVAMIDALNDSGVTDHLDSKVVAPFRSHVVEKLDKIEKATDAALLATIAADKKAA